jgi:hypothetical protein
MSNSDYKGYDDTETCLQPMGVKSFIILFIVFLFVVSDIYSNFVLSQFPGATDQRNITDYGIVLQGISLVIIFIILEYMIAYQII